MTDHLFDLTALPVSGHVFVKQRHSGARWMAKWRDGVGQHQRVLGREWKGRGRPPEGYLTRRTAEGLLDAILADARRGRVLAPRRHLGVTFEEAAAEWLRYVEHDRKRRASTLSDYERTVRLVLTPEFGGRGVETITARSIDAFRERLVAEGRLSARTINKYLALMHSLLKRAQRVWGLSANAAAGVERQPVRRSGDIDVLSPPEVRALARAAGSAEDAAIFLTAAFAGLRLGELRALRWRDVDFAKCLIHVRRSYVMGEEGTPKSGRVRATPLIDDVARSLDELSRRDAFTREDDFVFPSPFGTPFDDSALRRRFYASLKRAGLRHVRFHDLRHSFGTLAVQAFPLTDVKAYMGHADIATTMIYVHHVPRVDAARRLRDVIEAASDPLTRGLSAATPAPADAEETFAVT